MDHLAIMNKSWRLIPKIVAGQKTIESRWYKNRCAPWGKIKAGDTVYFKDAASPVTARAQVSSVQQIEVSSDKQTKQLVNQYGGCPGICFHDSLDVTYEWARGRRYVILIGLKKAEWLKPFEIDKTGYGNACAWMCVGKIGSVKKDLRV